MEKLTKETVDDILTKLSDALYVPIQFGQDDQDQNKVVPIFDVNAIFSKLVALCVYTGLNVPSTFGPAYNRVHADIEFFKKQFDNDLAKEALARIPEETKPLEDLQQEPLKENTDGVSESQ